MERSTKPYSASKKPFSAAANNKRVTVYPSDKRQATNMAIAYLGIGSNIGDKAANCEEAVRLLNAFKDIRVARSSSFYGTRPVGGPPQEDYLNGVVKVTTGIPVSGLLSAVKDIEHRMGREPSGRDHPRIIDIDILFYDDLTVRTEELTVPHPRMHKRRFVLKGLCEIAPEAVHPVLARTVRELYNEVIRSG